MVQVLVLGPIGVTKLDGRSLRLGSPLVQRLVGVLATEAGRPIGWDRLIEVLWGDSPPDGATNNLQVYVSRLRNELGRDTIETTTLGYALSGSVGLDAAEFERGLHRARSTDLADALVAYDDALALWRGPAFGAFAGEWWAQPSAIRLEELRLAAMAERIEVLIALGDAGRAVADSELVLASDPLKESSVLIRMRALHLSGRSADALRIAAAFRRRLNEQAGLSASPSLEQLEQQILSHDPAATRSALTRALRGYVFGELLAEGAHGAVYAATQPTLGRDVAIKVLRKDRADSPEFIRRFEAEAQFVARLEHPSIVPLYDYWREPGNAYLVLRLLRGGSLAQRIVRRESIPIDEIDLLVERIGDALSSAHGRGVVHRDVRAANVLYDDEGRPYLSDFGIAVAEGSVDEAGDDVAALAAMLLPLVGEDSSLAEQRSLLRRAATGEIVTARELVMTWRASRELITPTPTPDRARQRRSSAAAANPYVGLRTFDEADAALFFGRDTPVAEIVELVSRRPFVTVVGPSGAGKSSVVRAGVIPQLRAQNSVVTTMTPGPRPLYSLGVALRRVATEAQLATAGDDAARLLNEVAGAQPTVLVIDQLEELWTQSVPDDRVHLIKVLDEAISNARLRVISTIRADFYDRPLDEPLLAPLVQKGNYSLTALGAAELEASISGPLAPTGVSVEAGLVAQIVVDVTGRPAPLPLVQYALSSLYDRRTGNVLTLDAYRAIGGVAGAIASAAEELCQQLTPTQLEQCRELFANLVTPGESSSDDTRRRALRSELADIDAELIERLNQLRLLTFDRDAATGEPTVEIAHEALLTHWPRLRRWTDDQRDQLRTRKALRDDAAAWEHESRSASYLYRAGRLDTALDHVGTIRLTPLERTFLDASVDQRDREETRERKRLRRAQGLLAATAALLVIALVAGSIAFVQRGRANDQRNRASAEATAADLARMTAQSRADATPAPERAALLAVEAYRRNPTLKSAAAIQSVLSQQPKGFATRIVTGDATIPIEYGISLIAARVGPDIVIWDASTLRKLRTISDKGHYHFEIALSNDERYIASINDNRRHITVRTTADGRTQAELSLAGPATDIAFDPSDPARLAVSYTDGRFEIRRWATQQTDFELRTSKGLGGWVSFSDDGKLIATSGVDGTLQVADARSGAPVSQLLRIFPEATPGGFLLRASISPDGTLVAANTLFAARVFRISDGAVVSETNLDCPAWSGVKFIDDRSFVTTACGGSQAYDATTGKSVRKFVSSGANALSVAVSPGRDRLASTTGGDTIELWNLAGQSLGASRAVPLPPNFAANLTFLDRLSLNADMTRALLYDANGAYLYDLTAPKPEPKPVQFSGPGRLSHVSYTRGGRSMYSLHVDSIAGTSTIQIWDPVALQPQHTVKVPHVVTNLAVSPDLRYVAVDEQQSGTISLAVDVYEFETGALVHTFDGLSSLTSAPGVGLSVGVIEFSPDSKRLLLSSTEDVLLADVTTQTQQLVGGRGQFGTFDGTGAQFIVGGYTSPFTIYDTATMTRLRTGFTGRVSNRPQFHPTDGLLMTDVCCCKPPTRNEYPTAGLVIWDTITGDDIGTAGWHLNCGFWYPNGKGFVGYFEDRIEFWDLDPQQWVDAACRFAGRDFTRDEWDRYGPKDTYRETCPN